MLNTGRHRKLDFVTRLVALQRIGQHTEVVRPSADQILNKIRRVLWPNLAPVQRLPGRICPILYRVVLDQMRPLQWRLPRDQEPVRVLRYREIARLSGLRSCGGYSHMVTFSFGGWMGVSE